MYEIVCPATGKTLTYINYWSAVRAGWRLVGVSPQIVLADSITEWFNIQAELPF